MSGVRLLRNSRKRAADACQSRTTASERPVRLAPRNEQRVPFPASARASAPFALLLASILSFAQADQAKIVQQSSGWCSPNIANVTGNVTVICKGVDPRALQVLNAQLSRQNETVDAKTQEANEWARRYHELEKRLQEAGNRSELSRRAEELLHRGELDQAGAILDRLLPKEDLDVERASEALERRKQVAADDYFNRALVFQLQFRPLDALPRLEKAYRYRPDIARYGGEYAEVLLDQHQFKKAEEVLSATIEHARRQSADHPAANTDLAHLLWELGDLYLKTNRTEEAKAKYNEALNIYSQANDLESMAFLAVSMGLAYQDERYFAGAEGKYRAALDVLRQLAKQNPSRYQHDVAQTLNNLATVLFDAEDKQGAEAASKEAVAIYRELVKGNSAAYRPAEAQALDTLARIEAGMQRGSDAEAASREALDIYRSLAKANPDAYNPELCLMLNTLGDIYRNSQRLKDAEDAYQEALDLSRQISTSDPASEETVALNLTNLARVYQATQRMEKAEASYKEALQMFGQLAIQNQSKFVIIFIQAIEDLGKFYAAAHRSGEAEKEYQIARDLCRKGAQTNPTVYQTRLADVLSKLAPLYSDSGRVQDAEAASREELDIYAQLIKANPNNGRYHLAIAVAAGTLSKLYRDHQQTREADQARIQAMEAYARYKLTLTPDSAEVHEQLAEVLALKADNDGAINEYSKAIAFKPDSTEAHYGLGRAYLNQGRNDDAIAEFNRAIQLKKDYAEAFANRGVAHQHRGEYDQALEDFDQALKLKPDFNALLWVRGNTNFYLARFSLALADYQKGLESNPSQPYPVLWLHLARMRLGEDDTQDFTQRASKLDTAQWPGPVEKFYLHQMTGEQLLAAAKDDKGQICEANFYLAEDSLVQQKSDHAISFFRTARDICPKGYIEYAAAVAELNRLENGSGPR